MIISDNILKHKLRNVYFIWGSGKTTIANALANKYKSCYVYHTDDRMKHFKIAEPIYQPAMCRNVPDYWALDPDDARDWERQIVTEFTPMIIVDLVRLAVKYDFVICEGDIDTDAIIDAIVIENIVVISNHGAPYDFFCRPDQKHMLDSILNRSDLTDEEKQNRLKNAYEIVGKPDKNLNRKVEIPSETIKYGVKEIIRNDDDTIEDNAKKVEEYFKYFKKSQV